MFYYWLCRVDLAFGQRTEILQTPKRFLEPVFSECCPRFFLGLFWVTDKSCFDLNMLLLALSML